MAAGAQNATLLQFRSTWSAPSSSRRETGRVADAKPTKRFSDDAYDALVEALAVFYWATETVRNYGLKSNWHCPGA
jgi:hypothetical protein